MFTLTANDIQDIIFSLFLKDATTGERTPYNLSGANSIVLRLRSYADKTFGLTVPCSIMFTEGVCVAKLTVPTVIGKYYGEVEVFKDDERRTWYSDALFVVRPELG